MMGAMLETILGVFLLLVPLSSPGPKAAYCFEQYYLPELVSACGSTCGIVDCGSGSCPTCPIASNILVSAWGSYKCDNGKGMYLFISAIGKKRLPFVCVE
jgi:hypothetical protein